MNADQRVLILFRHPIHVLYDQSFGGWFECFIGKSCEQMAWQIKIA